MKQNQDIQPVVQSMKQEEQINQILDESNISPEVEILNERQSLSSSAKNTPYKNEFIEEPKASDSMNSRKESIQSQVTLQAIAKQTVSYEGEAELKKDTVESYIEYSQSDEEEK